MKIARTLSAGLLTASLFDPAFASDRWRADITMPSGGSGVVGTSEVALPGMTGRPAAPSLAAMSESGLLSHVASGVPLLRSLGAGDVDVRFDSDHRTIDIWLNPGTLRTMASGEGDAATRILSGLRGSDGRALSSMRDNETIGPSGVTVGEVRSVIRAAQRGEQNVFVRFDFNPETRQVVGISAFQIGGGVAAPTSRPGGTGGVAAPTSRPGGTGGAPVVAPVVAGPLLPSVGDLVARGSSAAGFIDTALPAGRLEGLTATPMGTMVASGIRINPGDRPGVYVVRVDLNNVHDSVVTGMTGLLPHLMPAGEMGSITSAISTARSAPRDSAERRAFVVIPIRFDSTFRREGPVLAGPIEVVRAGSARPHAIYTPPGPGGR